MESKQNVRLWSMKMMMFFQLILATVVNLNGVHSTTQEILQSRILCANTREECTCICAQTYVPLKLKRIAKKKRKMNQMYGNTVNSLLNHMVNTRLNQDVSYCGKRFYMKYMHFGLGG